MSIGVWVGLIALLGVDAETGVFMLLYLDLAYEKARREGRLSSLDDLRAAIREGAAKRIRPKFMTVATTMLGLVPIMWSTGTGADVMKHIAAPMVGGILHLLSDGADGLPGDLRDLEMELRNEKRAYPVRANDARLMKWGRRHEGECRMEKGCSRRKGSLWLSRLLLALLAAACPVEAALRIGVRCRRSPFREWTVFRSGFPKASRGRWSFSTSGRWGAAPANWRCPPWMSCTNNTKEKDWRSWLSTSARKGDRAVLCRRAACLLSAPDRSG